MRVVRIGLALLLGAALWAGAGIAAPKPSEPGLYSRDQVRARDRGVVTGRIASVDYGRGIIEVESDHRPRMRIYVLPSTSIFRRREEMGLSDLVAGMHVQISVSEMDGRLVAQIIRIT